MILKNEYRMVAFQTLEPRTDVTSKSEKEC
jgi:hypothetical protein